MADVRDGDGCLELGSFFLCEAWLGLAEVQGLVPVELQRCLDVMKFLLQAVLVTCLESTVNQDVPDSRLEASLVCMLVKRETTSKLTGMSDYD